jgi:formylglycine-generating enzyme required for sulfatase activity
MTNLLIDAVFRTLARKSGLAFVPTVTTMLLLLSCSGEPGESLPTPPSNAPSSEARSVARSAPVDDESSPSVVASSSPALSSAPSSTPDPAPTQTTPCPAGMIQISAGSFRMGTRHFDTSGGSDAMHEALVTLSSFCIDRTEVTIGAYMSCVRQGGCAPPDPSSEDQMWRYDDPTRTAYPVHNVTWFDAKGYCEAHDTRLPTEAEWEYAARGTDGRPFPWGRELPTIRLLNAYGTETWGNYGDATDRRGRPVVMFGDDGWAGPAPVGSFPLGASPFGVLDLAGNVAEWVNDRWIEAPEHPVASTDPVGPPESISDQRVTRGGSWESSHSNEVLVYSRTPAVPGYHASVLGFRCGAAVASRGVAPQEADR